MLVRFDKLSDHASTGSAASSVTELVEVTLILNSLQGGVAESRVSRFCHKEILLVTSLSDAESHVIAPVDLTSKIDVDSSEKSARQHTLWQEVIEHLNVMGVVQVPVEITLAVANFLVLDEIRQEVQDSSRTLARNWNVYL